MQNVHVLWGGRLILALLNSGNQRIHVIERASRIITGKTTSMQPPDERLLLRFFDEVNIFIGSVIGRNTKLIIAPNPSITPFISRSFFL